MKDRSLRRVAKFRRTQKVMNEYDIHELVFGYSEAIAFSDLLIEELSRIKNPEANEQVIVLHFMPSSEPMLSALLPLIEVKRLSCLISMTTEDYDPSSDLTAEETSQRLVDFLNEFRDI